MFLRIILVLLFSLFSQNLPAAISDSDIQENLAVKFDQIQSHNRLVANGVEIAAVKIIAEMYAQNNFRPLWTEQSAQKLRLQILRASEEGLNPADYHLNVLDQLLPHITDIDDVERLSDLDVLLTDSFVRLAYHFHFGKADPEKLDSAWNLTRKLKDKNPAQLLLAALKEQRIEEFLDSALPDGEWYARMTTALADYRRIVEAGGWAPIPSGPALKLGVQDPRVTLLRRRLALSNDGSDKAISSEIYDEHLEQAVTHFQWRHGLQADGIVGAATLAALNIPVQKRIDQLRVNLERFRWVHQTLVEKYILTDIAGFGVFMIKNGEPVWTARSQVGRSYRQTPVFRDDIQYLEFNPSWTVPPGILRNDILPKAAKDPDYIKRKGFWVLTMDGKRLDPTKIKWKKYAKGGFPYLLRQPPGPDNALGQVKFMFPNQYLVYLHDTPSKSLFEKDARAFSSGCIRVERPLELAELILADKPGWDRQRINEVLASRKTTRVFLESPLPIYLMYLTAYVDRNNKVLFRKDIYKRDKRVLNALAGEFRVRKSVSGKLIGE